MCMAGSLLTSWKPLILMRTTLTGKPRFLPVFTWLPICRWVASSAAANSKDSAQNYHFLYAVYGPQCTRFVNVIATIIFFDK